jgi:hypothetical protein
MKRVLISFSVAAFALGAQAAGPTHAPRSSKAPDATRLPLVLPEPETTGMREFADSVEHDFPLRSIGQLNVSNPRGSIIVQGWSHDRIRVKAVRRVMADSPDKAKKLFEAMDFRYRPLDQDVELAADYGKGLDIQQRLEERRVPHARMDVTIYAPARLKLRVWGPDQESSGETTVRDWNGPRIEVRAHTGPMNLESINSGQISLLCPSCQVTLRRIRGSVRCMAGSGSADLSDVNGSTIYVDTQAGSQRLEKISGEQLYVTRDGSIRGNVLSGSIQFSTTDGSVDLSDTSGFVSGKTGSGNITVRARDWEFQDRAVMESDRGAIHLFLPHGFSGEVDVWSVLGKVQVGFPLMPSAIEDSKTYGPEPANRIRGRIGSGGEQLRVYSRLGDVRVLKTF